MTPKTTVVTVTYGDRLAYLQQLIERALAFVEINEVIVVSNAALAPLEQLPERWPGKVRLIQLPHNTGSANGYAVALEAALAGGADYIWMMDDDNAPTTAAVSILHRELTRLGGLLGPERVAVLGYRATQQADVAQGVPPRYILQPRSSYFGFHIAQLPYKLWRRLPWAKRPGKRPASISLPFAPYGGMLAHRSLYQRIGVPLKELVLYVDDTEYTRRITAGGGRLFLFTDAVIEELEESWNIKARTRNIYETFLLGDSDFRAYYAARNQAWFDKNVWAASPRLHRLNRAIFLTLLRLIARLRNTRKRLKLIEQAIHDGENGALGMSKIFPLR
ncbi:MULTISPECIES: glycosyltransferase [Pseudomonadaceae]|uniref:glycosyltransferase n=1 Tax=Pseudomonadaceae TaxID=135621 RepID=UPI0015E282D9|nr:MULTISPECIES: glycosyltransferase [Pseudomonadaceae]MBA1277634.1 glycosyltransferase [Stutzerimonas stutzeri]MBC8650895.1 glycosyltransferase [Pseudomonas sp. MT4]QXY91151.1 glycosyltransferase [Pseudomonas sp. MTM4]